MSVFLDSELATLRASLEAMTPEERRTFFRLLRELEQRDSASALRPADPSDPRVTEQRLVAVELGDMIQHHLGPSQHYALFCFDPSPETGRALHVSYQSSLPRPVALSMIRQWLLLAEARERQS